jgi:phosphoribosylglycinamide formyltransferase-1
MKKLAILYSEYTPTVDLLINYFKDFEVTAFDKISPELKDYDLILGVNFNQETEYNILNTHYSLLPAFGGENPLEEAILAGAKVSGITIYYTNPFKIVTQYPVFITNDKHFDEIQKEMEYLEQTIYPLVVDKIIRGEQFEIRELLGRNSCGGGHCGKCGGCSD